MDAELTAIWLGVLSLFGLVVPALLSARQRRNEIITTSVGHDSDNNLLLIEQLQEEMKSLRAARIEDSTLIRQLTTEYRSLERRFDEYERGVNLLVNQLMHNGFVPVWQPRFPDGETT